ncbi:MAG: RIP metalloprotease RseP, partial [Planctomycetota bacterium JB042]
MPEPMSLAFLSSVGSAFWTVVGIGLVIFVHELGHFLCARWVGVRVEVFSLGFGPRLFGFVREGTDYRVSLVPFGGFVKMAGDQPGEGAGRSDELQSRSPGERFLIYSGGVLMNVVFALVAFPLIFWVGVPMLRPAVGLVEPGGPAWHAGLEEGDDIVSVNGRSVLGFTDIALEVALGDVERTEVEIERDGERRTVIVRPEYSEENGSYTIGIRSPSRYEIEVDEGGPAARAGLRSGDRVVALDGLPVRSGWYGVLDSQADAPVVFTIARDDGTVDVPVVPTREENPERKIIGIQVPIHVVGALRGRVAAADA